MSGCALRLIAAFVLAFIAYGRAQAQDFSQIPATKVYQVQAVVPTYPIIDSGDLGCTIIAEYQNSTTFNPDQWIEYTNPEYLTHPEYGEGCRFDYVYHQTGAPDNTVQSFQQNWVLPLYNCPAGYNVSPQFNPGGSYTYYCVRAAVADTKPSCPVNVGNPISCGTGKKTEQVVDTSFGGAALQRNFRSGSQWSYGSPDDDFGQGWYSLISARIDHVPATAYGSAVVYAFRPDGTVIPFLPDTGRSWKPEADLSRNALLEVVDASAVRIGWKYTPADGSSEHYDVKGNIVAVERDGVRQMSLQRDGAGRLLSIADTSGRVAQVHYDSSQHIDRIDLPDGQALTYTYDTSNRMASVTRAGFTTRYEYADLAGVEGVFLSKIIDEDDTAYAEFGYEPSGEANLTKHAGGVEAHSVTYRNGGSEVDVVFPSGRTETYTFDLQMAVRKLVGSSRSCIGCSGSGETRSYDLNGYLDLTTDAMGVTTDRDYDSRGLEVRRVEAANETSGQKRTTQTDWHAAFRTPTERRTYDASDALTAKSTWTHNARGQAVMQTQIDPVTSATRSTSTTYCEQAGIDAGTCPLLGLVTSTDGPRTDVSDVTTYTYYPTDDATCTASPTTCPYRKGDLWKVTNALGQVFQTLRYDGAGRVLSVKDANGVITDMEYHPRGWLTASKVRGTNAGSEADDLITRIEYEPTGLVKKTTLPDGSSTGFTYDAAHRLTDITDGEGNRIHYTLDNAGNRIKEDTLASNDTVMRTLSRVYNQLGQLQTAADAHYNPTDFVYDASGNTDTVTDALGKVSDNSYDPLNRLTQTIQDLGGINATTKFEYDPQDNLTAVIDPKSLATRYVYNGLGDLTKLTSPDTGVTNYTYDSAGNRKTQTDARLKLTTYGYDALNRLTTIGYATTSLNVVYTYDLSNTVCATDERFSTGRLTKLKDGSGTTQYCYNRFGQLTRKVQTTNAKVFTQRYAYAKAGQLATITYPDGTVVDYPRDALGRATAVGVTLPGDVRQVLLQQAVYYPFGPTAEWVFGNGRLLQRTLNQNYQPGVVQDAFPGGLSVGYEFNEVGNLSKLRNGGQNDPPLRLFGYDALNRLTDTKDGATGTLLEGYSYDATGNRQSATVGAVTTPYTTVTTSHRLSKVGAVTRGYSASGSTTSIGGTARQFVYDAASRMSQAKRNGAVAMNYRYNGKGEQVRRYLGTVNTYTAYDESGRWLGDYNTAGAPIQQAIWLDDLPVGVIANGKLHYVEADPLGTPRVVIDPQRDVAVWQWDLAGEAFGNSAPNQDPDGDASAFVFNMRFPGQRYDAASGLNYNYFRDYEPGTGRYVESDPIGLGDGPSTYGYARANSLVLMDPYGRSARPSSSYNFQNHKEVARAEAVAKLQRCVVEDCGSGNPYKVTQGELQQIIARVLSADIYLDAGDKDCGFSYPNISQYEIGIGGAIFSSSCCPIASVIAHEAAHLVLGAPLGVGQGTENEGKARFIQQQCFGCAKAYH